VVTSDLGGMRELVASGGGLTFRRADPADLAAVLRRLVADPAVVDRLRATIPAVKSIATDAADMERVLGRASGDGG
jgi:glycosyltransferase involved in cell wall biosynthesis